MTDLTKRAFFSAVAVGAVAAATAALAQPIVIECVEVIDDDWCWITEGGRRVRRRRPGREGGGGEKGGGGAKGGREGGGGEKGGGEKGGGGAKGGGGDPGGGGKGK